MKILTLRFLCLSVLISLVARAADTESLPRLTVELNDGSRVVGAAVEKKVKFSSASLGDLQLDVKDIRAVEGISSNSFRLTTANGDTLAVQFAGSSLSVKTSFGKVGLAVKSIRKFTVSATGGAGTPRPLAEWSFAQLDGDFVPDASGHGYDAQVYGAAHPVPRWGDRRALEFEGIGDNAFWQGGAQNCGLGIKKRLNRAFTELSVEVWLRKDPAWWMSVVYRDSWDEPSGFGLCTEWSSGKVVFGHYDQGVGHRSGVQSETIVQDGRWHHVVGTLQPATGQGYLYRIYVDGQLDAEQTGTWGVEEAPPGRGILKIAYPNYSSADRVYQGALDNIAIFEVALTPAQVKARFEASQDQRARHD